MNLLRPVIGWCLGNRQVVILFGLILMGAGVFSILQLNQELLPSIDFPTVYIVTPDPGASPAVVDREVGQPLTAALAGIPHGKHIHSTSSQGFSTVFIEFDLDSNLKEDADAVNQRLGQATLPQTAGKPTVQTFSFSAFPTMTYSIAATDGDLVRATREAKEVVAPALQSVKGVAQVKVSGGAQDGVSVIIDPVRLAVSGVNPQVLIQTLGGAQTDIPAGEIAQGSRSLPVEVLSTLRTVDDLKSLVVGAADQPGQPPRPIHLGDIASVTTGPTALNGISRTDGVASLSVEVIRSPNGNAVNISRDVRDRLAGLHLSRADRVQLVSDSADDINTSLRALLEEGLIGAVLAILVIWFFLGSLRATLVTAVSLPTSVLVALLGTYVGGFSLNILTLAGLTIAVGRIVDDAIVVLENSYRHLQQGESPTEAALNGASEVSSAVISSTLTTVAVFLPIGTVGGIISRFFLPFSVTVTIALLASLLVSLTVVPVLVSLFLQRRGLEERSSRLVRLYNPVLAWSLSRGRNQAAVLLVAVLALAASLSTLAFIGKNFFDFGSSATFQGSVTLPPGTTVAESSSRIGGFETAAAADPAVKLVQVTLASSDYGGYTAGFATNEARLLVLIRDAKQSAAVLKRLQAKLDDLYGAGNSTLSVVSAGPPSANFSATISGRDEAALRTASAALTAELQKDGEVRNAKSDLAAEKPEVLVTVDPTRAAQRGLSPRTIGLAVGQALNPVPLGTLGTDGPPVIARLDPATITADNLALLPVGPSTTLRDVASVQTDLAPTSITRTDGVRQVTISAETISQDTSGVSARATTRLQGVHLPSGVTLSTGGTSSDINDSFSQMFKAIAIAIALVFLILVVFFRSVLTPFVILMTMPLALIGAFTALFISRQALGLPSLLGVLMVFGIVVSNAILLVDFAERAGQTRSIVEALKIAGSTRLRPILMTAVATVMALLPVAIGLNTGGGGGLISQSLAVVVEGGMISSTVLTLVVIPVVYSLLRRRRNPSEPNAASEPAQRLDRPPA